MEVDSCLGGGSLTDGERILIGLDPHSTSTALVAVESPLAAGGEVKTIFEVTDIIVQPHLAASSSAPIATSTHAVAAGPQDITFKGHALPNSFVTLYIFSTPVVVTIKTDTSGAWTYTLSSELPNGNHSLYVATVDAGGKIIAKSPEVPFIKTAEAAEFTPLLVSTPTDVSPTDVLVSNLPIIGLILLLAFGIGAFVILGRERNTPTPPAPPALSA